jgi:NAD(P)-dependent dehydrogenase (short-subunit alcohol dehydrogenase family)
MGRQYNRRRAETKPGRAGGTEERAAGVDFVVVITGSTRGLGLALAEEFLRRGCRLLVSGRSAEAVQEARGRLSAFGERVGGQACDVTDPAQVEVLWDGAVRRWGRVDIWINNAGVGQDYLRAWELSTPEVIRIVETNILGVMHGSRTAMRGMRAQGGGAIYNTEGWGSDGKRRNGLTVYGTTKQAVRYFTRGLADEAAADLAAIKDTRADEASVSDIDGPEGSSEAGAAPVFRNGVLVGTLSPGMIVTDFLLSPMEKMADPERMRKIVNILGDRPETVARFLVPRILANRRNGAHIAWLTGARVIRRFLAAAFIPQSRRRDLFAAYSGGGADNNGGGEN